MTNQLIRGPKYHNEAGKEDMDVFKGINHCAPPHMSVGDTSLHLGSDKVEDEDFIPRKVQCEVS